MGLGARIIERHRARFPLDLPRLGNRSSCRLSRYHDRACPSTQSRKRGQAGGSADQDDRAPSRDDDGMVRFLRRSPHSHATAGRAMNEEKPPVLITRWWGSKEFGLALARQVANCRMRYEKGERVAAL